MRRSRLVLLVLGLLVLGAGVLVAQSTYSRHTEIFDFINGVRIGSGTTITGTSGTGTAALVLPVNSVGLGTEVSGYTETVTFCGDLGNATVVYMGPGTAQVDGAPTDYSLNSAGCQALDSATEGTADAPISTLAVKVLGFRCKQSAAPGANETMTYTLRTAAADAVTTDGGATTLSCTISGASATECRTVAGTTVNVVAGATLAIKTDPSYNASTQDAYCHVQVAWP